MLYFEGRGLAAFLLCLVGWTKKNPKNWRAKKKTTWSNEKKGCPHPMPHNDQRAHLKGARHLAYTHSCTPFLIASESYTRALSSCASSILKESHTQVQRRRFITKVFFQVLLLPSLYANERWRASALPTPPRPRLSEEEEPLAAALRERPPPPAGSDPAPPACVVGTHGPSCGALPCQMGQMPATRHQQLLQKRPPRRCPRARARTPSTR